MIKTKRVVSRPLALDAATVKGVKNGVITQIMRPIRVQPRMQLTRIWVDGDGREWGLSVRDNQPVGFFHRCPYGKVGDRLWVRVAWARKPETSDCYWYADDFQDPAGMAKSMRFEWQPAVSMPRSVARVILEITNITVMRVNDVWADDIAAIGCPFPNERYADGSESWFERGEWFARWWDSHHKGYPRRDNPWLYRVKFKHVIDLSQYQV